MTTKFRLEAVARFRKSIEQKWQTEVAATLAEIVAEQRLCRDLEQSKKKTYDRLEDELSEGIEVCATALYTDFLHGMDLRIEDSLGRTGALNKILKKKRESLAKATKDRRVIDRFKEIVQGKEADKKRLIEQKELDDFASIRYRRQMEKR